MELRTLESIGLTEGESKVYMALLELGLTTTGPIVQRSGISASKVYDILGRLAKKGLVSHIMKGETKHFRAADPSRILDYVDQKAAEIAQQRKLVVDVLPQLIRKRRLSEQEQEAEIYEGVRGIRTVLKGILEELNPNGSYDVFGASGLMREVMGSFFREWQRKKKEYGIRSRIIFDENVQNNKKLLEEYVGEKKFIPHDYYSPTDTFIYNDKITMFMWTADPPIAVVIKNKDTAEGYKNYFNSFWDQESQTLRGFEEIERVFDSFIADVDKNSEMVTFGAVTREPKADRFLWKWHQKRDKSGLPLRILFNEEMNKPGSRAISMASLKNTKVGYLPEQFATLLSINTCGSSVAIVIWKTKPIAFVIDNKEVADSFRKQFEMLWKISEEN